MVVVEIKSAETAKIESEINKVRIDKELIEKKYQLEKDIEKFTQKLSNWVSNQIKIEIKCGSKYFYEEIHEKDWQYKDAPSFDRCMKMLCEVFTKAGYKADFTYYSHSWQYRSGKICQFSVKW